MKYKSNFAAIKLTATAVVILIYLTSASNCAPVVSESEPAKDKLYYYALSGSSEFAPAVLNADPSETTTHNNNAALETQSELAQFLQSNENIQPVEINPLLTFTETKDFSEESENEQYSDDIQASFEEEMEKLVDDKEGNNNVHYEFDDGQGEGQSYKEETTVEAEEGEKVDDDCTDCQLLGDDGDPTFDDDLAKIPPEVLMALKESKALDLNLPDPDPYTDLVLEFRLCMKWWYASTANTLTDDDNNSVASTSDVLDTSNTLANNCTTSLAFVRIVVKGLEDKTTEVSFPLAKDNDDDTALSKEDIVMQNDHEQDDMEAPSGQMADDQLLFQPFVFQKNIQNDLAPTTTTKVDKEFHEVESPQIDFVLLGPPKDLEMPNFDHDDSDDDGIGVSSYGEDMNFFYVKVDGTRPLFNPFYILPIFLASFIAALVIGAVYNKFTGKTADSNKVLKLPRMAFCSSIPDLHTIKVAKKIEEDKIKIIA